MPMITNAAVTIYHREGNQFNRVYIPNCSWYVDNRISVAAAGVNNAEIYKVRIPIEELEGYLDPDQYVNADYGWTVDLGDYFVKGEGPQITKPSDITGRFGQVKSWGDNRRGGLPHLRFEGW